MCSTSVLEFFHRYADPSEFANKSVLEVGSRYVNGSVRPFIERFLRPRLYIGIDLEPGLYVDIAMPAELIVNVFGVNRFDVVIATELLEHVYDWRAVINSMKLVLKPGGVIYITTRSRGFPYHSYPYDFWRYEVCDMAQIFRDFDIIALEKDSLEPGVFLKARKPIDWKPINLSNIALYSILLGRRTKDLAELNRAPIIRRIGIRICNSKIKWLLPGALMSLIQKKYCI